MTAKDEYFDLFIKINGNLKKYTSYIRDQLINTNELKKAEKNVEKKLTKS